MTDPVSDLVVCRQRLDVLEQQAKAADCAEAAVREMRPVFVRSKPFYEAWSPIRVLVLIRSLRAICDEAEEVLSRHNPTVFPPIDGGMLASCGTDHREWPCADYECGVATVVSLAAVLAPERAVKP